MVVIKKAQLEISGIGKTTIDKSDNKEKPNETLVTLEDDHGSTIKVYIAPDNLKKFAEEMQKFIQQP